tara:strand:- start:268 stop:399 length:132 start_codon:yes stop_codon:yes gene_type:complete
MNGTPTLIISAMKAVVLEIIDVFKDEYRNTCLEKKPSQNSRVE